MTVGRCSARQASHTQRLLDSEPDGEPVPLAADAPVLLQADDLKVAFPVRKGSCVGWSIIIGWSTALAFSCAPARRWAGGESGSGKVPPARPAAPDPVRGKITFAGQPIQGRNRRQLLPLRRQMQVVFRIRTRRSIRGSRRSRSLRKACASTSRR